ncbi:MAG: class I SAM-dependent methyltransferase [Clostridia bacterium]|nr:class I SAM-dependent methyltransferase [Clostridia bacterium]
MYYNELLAAAYVRGSIGTSNGIPELFSAPLEEMSDEQMHSAVELGKKAGLKMYYFKEKDDLPRVKMTLGFLRSICPESLLDVGSGRGVFLFPSLRDFPDVPVTALDILPHRVSFLQAIHNGGIDRLTVLNDNICSCNAHDNSFDVVTMLEVLEHIPDAEKAIANAVRIAKRFIVVSVPSKPDDNPEHIHLFTKDKLTDMFKNAGAQKLHFGGVNGHLFMTAAKD